MCLCLCLICAALIGPDLAAGSAAHRLRVNIRVLDDTAMHMDLPNRDSQVNPTTPIIQGTSLTAAGRENVKGIHYMMTLVVLTKFLSIFFEAVLTHTC